MPCYKLQSTDFHKIAGALIEQHWEQLDEEGNTIHQFPDNHKIAIHFDDIGTIAYWCNLLEPLSYRETLKLRYLDNGITFEMNDYYKGDRHAETHVNPITGELR